MEVAYKSDHPTVLAAWEAYGADHKRFGEEVAALTKELWGDGEDAPGAMVSQGGAWSPGSRSLVGWQWYRSRNGSPPDGWKYEPKDGILSPKVSTREGKRIKRLFPAPLRSLDLPGMPNHDISHLPRFYAPGVEHHNGVLYVTWPERPGDPIDPEIWTEIRLSEYHVVREADPEYMERQGAKS